MGGGEPHSISGMPLKSSQSYFLVIVSQGVKLQQCLNSIYQSGDPRDSPKEVQVHSRIQEDGASFPGCLKKRFLVIRKRRETITLSKPDELYHQVIEISLSEGGINGL